MAQEIEGLLIRIAGDSSSYLKSLKESESATLRTATQLEASVQRAGKTAQAQAQSIGSTLASQAALGKSYLAAGQQALVSATQQVDAAGRIVSATKTQIQAAGQVSSTQSGLSGSYAKASQEALLSAGQQTGAAAAVAAAQAALARSYQKTGQQAAASAAQQQQAAATVAQAARQTSATQTSLTQKKAGQDAGGGGAGGGGAGAGGIMGAAKFAGPIVAAAVGIVHGMSKASDFMGDLVYNTTKLRSELFFAARASDDLAAAIGRAANVKMQELQRSDKPIEQRREEFQKKIDEAKKQREAMAKRVQAGEESIFQREDAKRGYGRHRKAAAIAPGAPFIQHYIEKFFGTEDLAKDKQKLEGLKKQLAAVDADFNALLAAQQQLEQELKNEAFRVQAAARETADLARVPEHLREGEKLRRKGAKTEDVEATQRETTKAMATVFAADTDKATRMLGLQTQNVMANTAELRVMEAALQGVAGAELEMMQKAAQANKFAEQELEVARYNQSLRESIAVLGKVGVAAEIAGRKAKGLSDAQVEASRALLLQKRGLEVTEQFLTPQAKFVRSMHELNELLQTGAINQFTYARAAQDARKQLEGQAQALQAIQGAAGHSAEALERFNAFQEATRLKPLPNLKDMEDLVAAQQGRMAGMPAHGGLQAVGGRAMAPMPGVVPPMAPQPQQQPKPMQVMPPAAPCCPEQKEMAGYLREIRDILNERAQKQPAINVGVI